MINVLQVVDALDEEQSDLKRFRDRLHLPIPDKAKLVNLAQADAAGPNADTVYIPPATGAYVQTTGIDPEGAAAEKGLAPGDIITEAGQQPVASVGDLNARIDEAREAGRKSLLVLVRRDGEPRFVALPVDKG